MLTPLIHSYDRGALWCLVYYAGKDAKRCCKVRHCFRLFTLFPDFDRKSMHCLTPPHCQSSRRLVGTMTACGLGVGPFCRRVVAWLGTWGKWAFRPIFLPLCSHFPPIFEAGVQRGGTGALRTTRPKLRAPLPAGVQRPLRGIVRLSALGLPALLQAKGDLRLNIDQH